MSNKTQLQTNNASLDSYIARVNAAKNVAASLPEAGGSGENPSDINEFCNIAIISDFPTAGTVFYFGKTGWDSVSPGHSSGPRVVEVACGSIMFVSQLGYYTAAVNRGSILCKSITTGFLYQVPNTPDPDVTMDIVTD
jgi:hypothetical protein